MVKLRRVLPESVSEMPAKSIIMRAAVAALLSLAAWSAQAQQAQPDAATTSPTPAEPRIDDQARSLMKSACEYLRDKQAFSVHGEATFEEVLRGGRQIQRSRGVTLLLKRPDRLRAEIAGDKGRREFYYDGKSVTIADIDAKVYGRFDAPASIEAMLDDAQARFAVTLPFDDLASRDPCGALKTRVEHGWYLGEHYFAGQRYHHLLLSSPVVDLQVWLPTSGPPLIRKLVITYKNEPGTPLYGVVFSDWNFTPEVDETKFAYTPPPDAHRIEFVGFAAQQSASPMQ
jgi:hypothetical protein